MIGSTNEERAFQVDDVIECDGRLYVVRSNRGTWGELASYVNSRITLSLHWNARGNVCRLHTPAPTSEAPNDG